MLYDVTHKTHYTYEAPVSQCLNEVRLTPRVFELQKVLKTAIVVEPRPVFLHHRKDYFGNDVSMFGVLDKHEELTATSQSLVEVTPRSDAPRSELPWETARQMLAEQVGDALLDASEFIYTSPFVPFLPELTNYARRTFTPNRPLLEVVKELSHRIHKEFTYDQKFTSIDSPLADVLRKKRGVCQDYAHVMIGAVRSQRLAARYVSGYVRSGGKFQGALASHAWVSVFIPEVGWIDFDPTNDLMPSDNHVTLAWGRDYGDVTPVKGVALGGGGQVVKVEVYMKPAAV